MEKKEPLLKGSIRVAKNQVFFEERNVRGIEISYDGITAIMIPSCLSEELKAIFNSWGQGVEKSPSVREGMNRTPCS